MTTEIPYYNYKGPLLTKATIDDVDIIEIIQNMYGPERNWNHKLWRLNDFLTEADIGKKIYFEFVSTSGNISTLKITVTEDLTVVFNGPIFTPFCDCGNRETCQSSVCSKINPECDCNQGKNCSRICGNN